MGVYTDTDNLQPFTFELEAGGPREAVVLVIARTRYGNDGMMIRENFEDIMGEDLEEPCARENIRLVSVRPTYKLKPRERLHGIEEFSAAG